MLVGWQLAVYLGGARPAGDGGGGGALAVLLRCGGGGCDGLRGVLAPEHLLAALPLHQDDGLGAGELLLGPRADPQTLDCGGRPVRRHLPAGVGPVRRSPAGRPPRVPRSPGRWPPSHQRLGSGGPRLLVFRLAAVVLAHVLVRHSPSVGTRDLRRAAPRLRERLLALAGRLAALVGHKSADYTSEKGSCKSYTLQVYVLSSHISKA